LQKAFLGSGRFKGGGIDNTLLWMARQAQSLLKIGSFKTLKNCPFPVVISKLWAEAVRFSLPCVTGHDGLKRPAVMEGQREVIHGGRSVILTVAFTVNWRD